MSSNANQYQINPETHPADAAMQKEHGVRYKTEGLSADEAALWNTPTDQLKAQLLAQAGARDDFKAMQQSLSYMEQTAQSAAMNPNNNEVVGNAISAGLKAEAADRKARASAHRLGVPDTELADAERQLADFSPHALAPDPSAADPSADFASITENADGTLRVKLRTGETYAGDPRKIIDAMGKSYVFGKEWTRGIKAENAQLKNAQVSPQNGQPQPAPVDGTATPYSSSVAEEFARSVGFSGAEEMVADYQRTQQQLAEMQSKLEKANEFASRYEDEQVSQQFMAMCPSFPGDERSVNELMKVMNASDLDFSKPENLALAHEFCVRQHFYEPLRPDEIAASYGQAPQSQGRTPPPQPPPQNSPDGMQGDTNPWAMATDELRRKVLQQGGLGKALMNMEPGSTFGV